MPTMVGNNMWNPDRESMPRSDIVELQGRKLHEQVKHIYNNSDLFRNIYDKEDIHPNDIQDLDDLHSIPILKKDQLRDFRDRTGDFWCGTLCVPESELEFVCRSTGTSGDPNFFGWTKKDLEEVAETTARALFSFGLRRGDTVNMMGKNYWHGTNSPWELGAREIEAVPIRLASDTQNISNELFESAKEADFDALFLYQLEKEIQYINDNNINPEEVFPNLKFVFSAVDASKPKREAWEELWNVPFMNSFGSGDQMWMMYSCPHSKEFFHAPEDQFIIEILDTESGEPVEQGEVGQLVVSNLRDRANPYIRYFTEDLVEYTREPCDCGRNTIRVKPLGRSSWSVEVSGRSRPISNIEVEEVLWSHEELFGTNYQLVEKKPGKQDELKINIATTSVSDDVISDVVADVQRKFDVPVTIEKVGTENIKTESAIKMERVKKEY